MGEFDLIIVGGGPVGAGLAIALRQTGLRIALIDARPPSQDDPRLFALTTQSCQFLNHLKLWEKLADYAQPIQRIHVSHQHHFGTVRLNTEEVNLPQLGYVIPAHYLEAALNLALTEIDSLTLYRPARLLNLLQTNEQAKLTIMLEGEEKTLHAPLIIGADGTESTVRKELGIKTEVIDYKKSAIVTRIKLKRPHQGIAHERFTDEGAIAMLPLCGTECAMIWTANHETIATLSSLSDDAFLQRLQKEFGYRLGRLQQINKRYVFPLRMVRTEKNIDQCVYLVGNAAHTMSPIAAQGLNLSLYEIAALAETISEKCKQLSGFTSADWQSVNDKVQQQQAISMGLSHHLSHLFSHSFLPLSILLSLGIVCFDLATPLKKRFINSITGRRRALPSLLMSTT